MRLVEIRHLEGPNLFLNHPAIKLELQIEEDDAWSPARQRRAQLLASVTPDAGANAAGEDVRAEVAMAAQSLVRAIHGVLGLPEPVTTWRSLELPGHVAVAFSWERRSVARAIARLVADLLTEPEAYVSESGNLTDAYEARLAQLRELVQQPATPEDAPELIQRREGQARIVAVTGTNGKTTTTRLIAQILRQAGQSVGWTSTSGVYINGKEIESGDWSGPGGAHLLLERDDLDWAILETARGGILRRGLAFSEADVTVFINVSADHLGDYGVLTVEGIAEVKAVVPRATAPDGLAVLNADDPLVVRSAAGVRAPICLVSQSPGNPLIADHERAGGLCVIAAEGALWVSRGGERSKLVELRDVPITYGGRAAHMVENVLCAVGGSLGCGVTPEIIAPALSTFGKSLNDNPGRLNAYDVNDVLVLVDYAHNEAGLSHLLRLAKSLAREDSEIWTIIGSAGDRGDQVLQSLGRMAATDSDHVVAKDSLRYLRGRKPGEIPGLLLQGVAAVDPAKGSSARDEIEAITQALALAKPGDVIAVMASDLPKEVRAHLERIGRPTVL